MFFSLTFLPLASSLLLSAGSARKGYSGSRRDLLAAAGVTAMLPRAVLATGNMPAVQGAVTTMDGSVKAAKTPEAAKKQIFKIYEMECSANASSERLRSEDYCNGLRDSWFNIHSYAIMDKRNQEVRVYFPPEPSAR